MLTMLKRKMVSWALASILTTAPLLAARQPADPLPAPLPAQIISAKRVFISNAGGDSNGLYSGGPDRLYNQFYAVVKDWGRYQLAASPAEADLILQVSFSNPFVGEHVSGGSANIPVTGRSVTDPQFRLILVDPATRITLWTFIEHVETALLQSNRDKKFDQALSALANDVRNVAGQPAADNTKN